MNHTYGKVVHKEMMGGGVTVCIAVIQCADWNKLLPCNKRGIQYAKLISVLNTNKFYFN